MMTNACVRITIIATLAVLSAPITSAVDRNAGAPASIPPRVVADFLHAVIMAHRNFYTIHIVNPLLQEGIVDVSENWRAKTALPLPVQFLQETSEMAELTSADVHYHLISQWPINKANAPVTEFERRGLEAVQADPTQPYSSTFGGASGRRFGTVYADLAVTRVCIDCHNTHSNSPRSDFNVGDVMGGLVISFPLP
ncbi:MAG: DUF3365 domain-containing protein [Nitrospira sp.]